METPVLQDLIFTMMQGRQSLAGAFHDQRLTLPECIAMALLAHNDENEEKNVYADDLQTHLHVSKPAISQMLKSLENAGYIVREINPANRRKLTVILTKEGRVVLEETMTRFHDISMRIIETFGEEKTCQLMSLCTEFLQVVHDVQQQFFDGKPASKEPLRR